MHFIVALVRCIYHTGRETDSSACKAIERGQSDKKLITSHTNNVCALRVLLRVQHILITNYCRERRNDKTRAAGFNKFPVTIREA
jgi:hypothetical protein